MPTHKRNLANHCEPENATIEAVGAVVRFVEDSSGEIFRVLLEQDGAIWLISHHNPAQPFPITGEETVNLRRIPMPATFPTTSTAMTEAQRERLELIQPLLDDMRCVTDKEYRRRKAQGLAEANATTAARIVRLYYRYLARGRLTESKARPPTERSDYDWAIRTFYFSAKRLSLRTAYDMMLVQRYSDANGQIVPGAPTWPSFQHYFYSRNYHKQPRKVIAREGLTHYQRNCRPLHGSASDWRPIPGCFQMDATQADIYLVSRHDRSQVIGRPNIYLAVDTATQLITGVYVGLDAGESAVMECLAQAVADKVEWCRKYGIEITASDWPSCGLPSEIITDKGREFWGGRMEELCQRYGIEMQSLPPFRPDGKGLVEKAFDLLQQRYKPLLRGKGVIEGDAQERWATDYRQQAVLTLDEYTQVIIHCIVYLNSGRVLENGKTPAKLWQELCQEPGTGTALLEAPAEEVHRMALPRMTAKLTRKGFLVNSLLYVPEVADAVYVGDTYPVAYDPADLSYVYVVTAGVWIRCPLADSCAQYLGLSEAEAHILRDQMKADKREARQSEVVASTVAIQEIQKVVQQANEKRLLKGKQSGVEISEARESERRRLS